MVIAHPTDQLSQVFDLVEVRGLIAGGFAVAGDWRTRLAIAHPLKLAAVACGRVRLTCDGLEPVVLATGDVAILNRRTWVELEGGPGARPPRTISVSQGDPFVRVDGADCPRADMIVGGHIDLNPAGAALLTQALPPVAHVRADSTAAPGLRAAIDRLIDEAAAHDRIGSAFALRQHGQLLVLEVLRAWLEQADLPPGWLRLLTDDRLRPAVQAMHAEPARAWQLPDLAAVAAMSRTTFATRFRSVAGVPPLSYLASWRMLLAQQALRDGDVRVGALAARLGYGSEGAFSAAFKREVGVSPLRYRAETRA